jgi:hypothetical protein
MDHGRRHDSRARPSSASKAEVLVFWGGLVLSAVAGVVAYRVVGLYGDGPFSYGYHRITEPDSGKSLLVHETRTPAGRTIRRVIDDKTLTEVDLDVDGDGRLERVHVSGENVTRVDRDADGDGRPDVTEYYNDQKQFVKAGFSLSGDGVIDAWAYRDGSGQLAKIEVSTRRDGNIDRWEFYDKGQLARVEEDRNHNGTVDHWSSYDAGILMTTVEDADGDGRPDSPISATP